MTTITTRAGKGTPLTNAEVDANFTDLNTNKLELGQVFSSGTANGVLYLNGSKVATSGSALTYDGSYFTAASGTGAFFADIMQVSGTATKVNANGVGLEFRGGATPNITSYSRVGSAYLPVTLDALTSTFSISGTERMRLNSTSLNIGGNLTSTNNTLQVTGNAAIGDTLAGPTDGLYVKGNVGIGTNSPAAKLQSSAADGSIIFGASGTTKGLRIVTDSTSAVIQGIDSTLAASYQPLTITGTELYFRSGSGTPSEKMRLDSSGNLGIGGISPVPYGANNRVLQIDGGANASEIRLTNNTTGTAAANGGLLQMAGNDLYIWNVENSFVSFGTNNTEKARITATGGFETRPEANGNAVFNENSVDADFRVESDANTHRLFVDAGADTVLMGTTTNTNSSKLVVDGSISETVSSTQYLVASQYDIGTAANEIPLNQYLGNLAYQDASSIAGQVGLSAGTAALPSLVSATDLDTGMWFPAANTLAWSTNGARVMTLDSSGNLGLKTTTPIYDFQIGTYGTDTDSTLALATTTSGTGSIRFGDGTSGPEANAGLVRYDHSIDAMLFWTAATERTRITSTGGFETRPAANGHAVFNEDSVDADFRVESDADTHCLFVDASTNCVGIGTNAPTFKLDVSVTNTTAYSSTAYSFEPVLLTNLGAGGVSGLLLQAVSTGTANTAQATISAFAESASSKNTALAFGTRRNSDGAVVEGMRLDSSGNLGLGVTTLSAWSAFKHMAFSDSTNTVWSAGANDMRVATNYKYDGGAKYVANGLAAQYIQTSGQRQFYTAPNNTSGASAPLSFTQAMTLNASGNLGVGTTSDNSRVSIEGSLTDYTTGTFNLNRAVLSLYNSNISGANQGSILAFGSKYNDGGTGTQEVVALIKGANDVWTNSGAGNLQFYTSASGAANNLIERARIDSSGNLLIGSTSTSGLITGQLQLGTTSSSNAGIQFLNSTTGSGGLYFGDSTSGNARFRGSIEYSHNSDAMLFSTAETERARITSAGDFELKGGRSIKLYNAANNATSEISSDATGLTQFSHTGVVRWLNATATGTLMTLDASGNLLVGTTTTTNNLRANERLAIVAAGNNTYTGAAFTGYSGTTSAAAPVLDFNRSRGTTDGSMTVVASGDRLGLIFARGSDGTNFVDAASIDFWVDGTPGSNDMPGRIVFSTTADGASSTTERARITSGGYFKASNSGTYLDATGTYHELRQSASVDTVFITNTNASPTNMSVITSRYTGASPNNTTTYFLYCSDGGSTVRANIRSNGGLANYQSNNVDLSDIRTKTDINPLGSYWNKIAALEIVTYKYKDQTHDDLNIGVIAQQVEQVAPEFVDPDGFGETPEDGVPLKTIYNKDLTFAAIKALQEAMARIEKLEAEVAALKGV